MPQPMVAELVAARSLARLSRGALLSLVCVASTVMGAETALSSGDTLIEQRETKAWFVRIQEAASKRSYQGTVIVSSGGTVASSRITHHAEGRDQYERIESLDGQPRLVVRHNDQIHTIWPERRLAMVEPRDQTSSFPGLVQAGGDQLTDFYELRASGGERVAGRDAHVLVLRPRDAHRYGYRLWADKATSLLLRTEVLNERGSVLESSAFSDLTVGGHPSVDNLLQPVRKLDGFRVVRTTAQSTKLSAEGWNFSGKVPGFQQISCVKRPLDGPLRVAAASAAAVQAAGEPQMLQVVYSDGLTSVSVFIEPYRAERHTRPMHTAIGATQTLMRRQGEWWVTLLGDVPAPTLRLFAEGLERSR